MLEGKKVTSVLANRIMKEALLCRSLKCTPDKLRGQDPEKMEAFSFIYTELAKKNPMNMFGG